MLNRLLQKIILAVVMLTSAAVVPASMQPLDDSGMQSVTGTGLALGAVDFSMLAGATTYFEAIGSPPPGGATYQRGDGRYYGISISGNAATSTWGGPCVAGINNMGCPIGGAINYFAPFDNPFVLRVFDYTGINFSGTAGITQTIFELLAPTNSDPFKWASWTELVVGGNTANRLQGQLLLSDSKLSALTFDPTDAAGTRGNNKIRILKHTNLADPTVGFIWENNYEGDFRFSVNQQFISADTYAALPFFTNNEGFYALNIRAYVPLGQMFYQSLILDDTDANDGNFAMIVTRIPNQATAFNDFYSIPGGNVSEASGYTRVGRTTRYYQTHGVFEVGSAGTTNNNGTTPAVPTNGARTTTPAAGTRALDTTDGVFFVKGDASPTFTATANKPAIVPNAAPGATPLSYTMNGLSQVNIGDINVQGILIQYLKITTCSAGGASAC